MSKERESKKEWTGFKIKFITLCMAILLLVSGAAGFHISNMLHKQKQPEITTAYISGKIDNISELTTIQLEYNGLIILSDGDIPFLTQKGFSMRYTASIRAGIDMSKIKISISEEQVTVTIPDAQIQSVNVNSDSLVFYDEKHALFNWTKKEDIVNALSLAKEDAKNGINADELIDKAESQTEMILQNILTDSIGGRKLIIK